VQNASPGRGPILEQLRNICRRGQIDANDRTKAFPTGFQQLDGVLPGGGWPVGAVTELMTETDGIGELSLVMPALARLTQTGRCVALLAPPYPPYAPAWAQQGVALEQLLLVQTHENATTLWAGEQLLRCAGIGAVLAWPAMLDDRQVRRLQLAAEAGNSCGLLYRPPGAAQVHSPAALRLRLRPDATGLRIDILKARGGHAHALVVHPSAAAAA
jgi:hypothetical protein